MTTNVNFDYLSSAPTASNFCKNLYMNRTLKAQGKKTLIRKN